MRVLSATLLLSCAVVLAGCTGMPVTTTTSMQPNQVQGAALQGRVHGGQQPISGAQVYLYAADATGYGKASDSLLNSPGYVTTDSNGNFSITGDYTCPSASTQVYLYSGGGNPGAGTNPVASLMAGLGSCGSLTSSTFVTVNEISTVAMAYSVAGFATDALHVSSSGTTLAQTGIANAFAEIPNLETLSTGTPLGTTPAGNGALWRSGQVTISIADILAACINTNGSMASGSPCNTLLTTALSGGTTGTQPAETATAAINIAHHPGSNLSTLMTLQTAESPFQPFLNFVPTDMTMGISYTASWLQIPYAVAVDAAGNVWVTAEGGTAGELHASSYTGSGGSNSWATATSSGGLSVGFPYAIAIDPSGNIWIPMFTATNGASPLVELNSTGAPISPSGGYPAGPDEVWTVAIDASGNVWTPSFSSNALDEYVPGTGWNGTGFTGGGLNEPYSAAIDTQGNIWMANLGSVSLSEFNSSGVANSHSPYPGSAAGMSKAGDSLAIDALGNIWVVVGGGLFEFNSSGGGVTSSGGYTGGGLANAMYLAIDGAGNVFTSNYSSDNISEFSPNGTALSPSDGFQPVNGLSALAEIAIDGSGNVWVANKGGNSLVEVVGLAGPVVTPISANLKSPYGSHAVNMP